MSSSWRLRQRFGERPQYEEGAAAVTKWSSTMARTRMRRPGKPGTRGALHYAAAVAVVLVWLFPLLWILLTSFKTRPDIFSRIPLFAFVPTLDNYVAVLSRSEFTEGLINSIKTAGLTTLIAVLVGPLAAYPLARLRFPARDQILFWVLSLRMLPTVAIVVPFYLILYKLGLLDTLPGLVVAYLSFSLPFAIWMLVGFVHDLPKELDDAAFIDGCSHGHLLWLVHFPLLRPALAVIAIFTFVFAWNELVLALMLTEVDAKTVPVAIIGMVQPDNIPWGEIAAGSILTLLPMMAVVFALQRHIVRGLTLGAVRE
jgi:multiple sugar transport system permease protein